MEAHKGGMPGYIAELSEVLLQGKAEGKIVAIGECGIGTFNGQCLPWSPVAGR
jgi:hypothetical protein